MRYEYKIREARTDEEIEEISNQMSEDGWELDQVMYVSPLRLLFKRSLNLDLLETLPDISEILEIPADLIDPETGGEEDE